MYAEKMPKDNFQRVKIVLDIVGTIGEYVIIYREWRNTFVPSE